jgi:hypothetical protein
VHEPLHPDANGPTDAMERDFLPQQAFYQGALLPSAVS